MIYTVVFTGTNTFIKGAKNVAIKKYDADGVEVYSTPYRGSTIPGTGRWYLPQVNKNEVLIDMSQTELNDLVKDLYVYDEKGDQVLDAPIKNPSAKFWRLIENIFIEYAGKNFDDENPWDRFWLACFRADQHFNTSSKQNDAMNDVVKFKVTKTTDIAEERFKDVDEVSEAIVLLSSMEFAKQVQILKAFGVTVNDPDPKQVERALKERIITKKDSLTDSGERYIDFFLRLSKTANEDLNIHGVISAAINKKIITRNIKSNKYYYNDIPVGRTKDDVYNFFKEDDSRGLLEDLMKKTNVNKD